MSNRWLWFTIVALCGIFWAAVLGIVWHWVA
jgi:hypothetical protein